MGFRTFSIKKSPIVVTPFKYRVSIETCFPPIVRLELHYKKKLKMYLVLDNLWFIFFINHIKETKHLDKICCFSEPCLIDKHQQKSFLKIIATDFFRNIHKWLVTLS